MQQSLRSDWRNGGRASRSLGQSHPHGAWWHSVRFPPTIRGGTPLIKAEGHQQSPERASDSVPGAVRIEPPEGRHTMDISGSIALITGANRGIGRRFAEQLLDRGAAKVYATARTPSAIDIPGVETLQLDITDPNSVAAAAVAASDATLLINNAGVATMSNLVTGDLDKIRLEMDTHFYGTLSMVRAFAPVLAANGGGAILNVLSALSWFSTEGATAYGAAKSAEWSLTNGIRLELAKQGTLVTGVHLGAADTDIMAFYENKADLLDPSDVARIAIDGVEAGQFEVLVDDASKQVKASLANDPSLFYQLSPQR